MMTTKEYQDAVMESYFTKYGGDDIAVFLVDVKVGKLKELAKFLIQQKRYLPQDKDIINRFLAINRKEKLVTCHKEEEFICAIQDHGYNEFKRLTQFISRYKENTKHKTDTRNIDFIAWLIDYRPRPYSVNLAPKSKSERETQDLLSKAEQFVSEKEIQILKQLVLSDGFLKMIRESLLNDVLKEYQLEKNESFCDYRKQVDNDFAMQAFTISELESKVVMLQNKLKRARLVRRWTGAIGLFFVSIDYREPSLDIVFEDLLEMYQGFDDDDFLDDLT